MSPHEEENKIVDVDFGSGDGGSAPVSVDTNDGTTATTTTNAASPVADPWSGFSAPSSSSLSSSDPNSTSNDQKTSVPLKTRLSNFRNQVSVRMAESKARQQSARATAEEAAKKDLEGKAASMVLTELNDEETYEQLRPSKISVTVFKGENESYGFGLDQKDGEKLLKRNVVITSLVDEGLLRDSPLKEGDYIRRVNGRRATVAEACIEQLVGLTGYVSLEAETPQGNPAIVTAFCRKPSADYENLGLSLVNVEHEHEQEQETVEVNNGDSNTQDAANNEDKNEDKHSISKAEGTEMDEEEEKDDENTNEVETDTEAETTTTKTKTRLLKIGDIQNRKKDDGVENEDNVPNAGLMADSVLSPGDLVLAINGTPCANMDVQEAMELIRGAKDTLTIVALNPEAHATATGPTRAQRFMRQAKRTSIAIGGGSMVGVGLILIPTVPPPFGEVLIAGGVTVLSSEFEAPKRVVRNARDSLESSVGRNEMTAAAATEATALEGPDIQAGNVEDFEQQSSKEAEKNNSPPKWGRLKKFSRNYVLPFLDHVVGDKKHENEKEVGKQQEKDEPSPSEPTEKQSDPTKESEEATTASDESNNGEVDSDETNNLHSTAAATEEKKVDG